MRVKPPRPIVRRKTYWNTPAVVVFVTFAAMALVLISYFVTTGPSWSAAVKWSTGTIWSSGYSDRAKQAKRVGGEPQGGVAIGSAASNVAGKTQGMFPTFSCYVTKVHDGDGPLWCREGPKVRLSAIAARELDGSCLPAHPCPATSAIEAKAMLERLALGVQLTCRQVGTSYNRVVALCSTPDRQDLSCAMIASGTVLRWERYDPGGALVKCVP